MPINQLNSTGLRSNDMIGEADNQTFRKLLLSKRQVKRISSEPSCKPLEDLIAFSPEKFL